jgi:hypothetical protein
VLCNTSSRMMKTFELIISIINTARTSLQFNCFFFVPFRYLDAMFLSGNGL